MSDSLQETFETLKKAGPAERAALMALSGLERAQAARVPALLADLPSQRQREVIEALVGEAERTFEADFGLIYRELLDHIDPVVRRLSVEGLVEDIRLDLIKPFLRLLESDPDESVRATIASTLGRFLYAGEEEDIPAERALAIREVLERCLLDARTSIEVARRALESLAYINDDIVKRLIDQCYSHENEAMRISAIFAMGRSADPCWADTVLAELYSETPAMRYEAARAAGELQLREAVETLTHMIGDRDAEIRYVALQALGQIGGQEARKVLERYAEADDPDLAEAAEEALTEASLADMVFDMMVIDPLDSDFVLDKDAGEEQEELSEEEEAFRDDYYRYAADDEDDKGDWPDEYLSLN